MYTEKAKKNADACRFCWMCRHLCPVELATGKETNTPRAKGLQVSMMERGFEMDRASARTMYECMLCGSCTNDCATGFEPPVFIREGRTQALLLDLAPKGVTDTIARIERTGNMFGQDTCMVPLDAPQTGDMLLWLGETARFRYPAPAIALMNILRKAGVAFACLPDEPASGSALGDLMGFVEDVRAQAQKAGRAIRASNARRVIVLDSYDAALMRHEYKDWGIELPEIITATAFVDTLIKEGKLIPQKKQQAVSYHDASRLARDLDEHQPARDILTSLGCEITEMWRSRRLAKCCGSAVVFQYDPALCRAVAKKRWEDARYVGAQTLVSACPQSGYVLSETTPDGCTYQDLFVLLDQQL